MNVELVYAVEFRACAMDYNCSVNAIKVGPVRKVSCNGDNLWTCSDVYATYKAYPQECGSRSEETDANFRNIEDCMMRVTICGLENKVKLVDMQVLTTHFCCAIACRKTFDEPGSSDL